MSDEHVSARETLYAHLIDRSHLAAPADLAALVLQAAEQAGAVAVIYLNDVEQDRLVPVPAPGVPERVPVEIDNSIPGRAYRTVTVLESQADGARRLWLPLLDGTARVGVLELEIREGGAMTRSRAETFAGLVAELIVSKDLYGDTFKSLRRRRAMRLAADMQSELLPPLTCSTASTVISGVLEPSYSIAGDAFDYAMNGDVLDLVLVDAMGHGFEATLMSTVAVGVYRHARREGADLLGMYAAMDEVIRGQFGPERFVTAQLVKLDMASGRFAFLNAGHHPPMLVRKRRHVESVPAEPTLPLGLGFSPEVASDHQLEPGDIVLFYTDGVVEARAANGEFFGEQRLADLLLKALAADLPAAETVRRLSKAILRHQGQELQDDATVLLVEWRGRDRAG